MIRLKILFPIIFCGLAMMSGCQNNKDKTLTIFYINDPHSRLENFAKIKHIVDKERQKSEVLLLCGGDIFTGDPLVDQYPEKGFPIIELMNQLGFDASVLGNHEYDYGQKILADRMNQATFQWVCANVDMKNSGVPEPPEFLQLEKNGIGISILGLVETTGHETNIQPATHPFRVRGIEFSRPATIVEAYQEFDEQTNSDVYIALTHLGHDLREPFYDDYQLAMDLDFLDVVIGGHTQTLIDTLVNNTPVLQADEHLKYLGRLDLRVTGRGAEVISNKFIDLSDYPNEDEAIAQMVDKFEKDMERLESVIGFSVKDHSRSETACLFAEGIKKPGKNYFALVNGAREMLDQGPITERDALMIAPFNNYILTYAMTVAELKQVLMKARSGYISGCELIDDQGSLQVMVDGQRLADGDSVYLSTIDYLPARNPSAFADVRLIESSEATDAEMLIAYLRLQTDSVDFQERGCRFRF